MKVLLSSSPDKMAFTLEKALILKEFVYRPKRITECADRKKPTLADRETR